MTRDTSGHDGINRRGFLAGGAAAAGLGLTRLGSQEGAEAHSTTAETVAAGRPTGLLTSLLDDPLGVPTSGLRMSWIVPALGVAPMQAGYQIQLAAAPAGFTSSGELIWDSGRVNDTSSVAIGYTGPALSPATPYWWRVRTWVGGQVSAWSEPQRIVTEAAEWTGIPVWAPAGAQTAGSNDWALLRTGFTLPAKPVRCAFIQATAQSPEGARQYAYKLWCNGTVAGRGPVRSMGSESRYQTHDITAFLRPGPNALAALCYAASGRQFQAQATVVFDDGSRQVIGTSGSWRALNGARLLPPSGFTGGGYFNDPQEFWDMRQEPAGWTQPGFDDSAWLPAAPGQALGALAPAAVNIEQHLVQPAAVTQVKPGTWLVDLGQEIAGGLHLRVNGTAGDTLTVQLGEQVNGTSVAYHLLAGNTYSEVWTLRDGWQDIEHWGYRGFRWAQLISSDTSLDLSTAVQGVALHMAWHEEDSAFDCSNPDLTRVWEFARYSIKATSLDVYQDTPTRERGPYEGDALINQRSQYAVQRTYGLARYSNSYLCRRPTWPTEYHLMSVLSAWADYMATGDPGHLSADYAYYVAKNYDADLGSDGLVHKTPGSSGQNNADLVDWPATERDGYVFTNVNTVINSFQYAAYATLSEVAAVLGNQADAAKYAGLADRVRTAINTLLLPAGADAYVDGEGTTHTALHATLFPVALGVAENTDLPALGGFLASGGAAAGGPGKSGRAAGGPGKSSMACAVYAAQFLLDALFAAGQADAAHALLTSAGLSSWLHMMDDLHATITMEAWDPSIKPNTTFSHAWATAPANVVARHILGVQVTSPGAAELLVRPMPGPLTWMSGTVPTIRGPVRVSVDRRHALRAVIDLPPNTTGRIELDTGALGVDPGSLRIQAGPARSKPAITHDGAVVTVSRVRPGPTTIIGSLA
ncbi:MAG TPA: family 78 glycoside hydrolase catalytic domain [Streptosporangiaceae bacterium]